MCLLKKPDSCNGLMKDFTAIFSPFLVAWRANLKREVALGDKKP